MAKMPMPVSPKGFVKKPKIFTGAPAAPAPTAVPGLALGAVKAPAMPTAPMPTFSKTPMRGMK